ncbi:MAG: PAS domain S-box protein, partial [Gammaproteobacteria bacterium]|nr:PAS domain S-box protein [Gammaproteobacteria bacterium]
MNFSKSTHINIALLHSPDNENPGAVDDANYLTNWDKNIILLSNYSLMKPVFSKLTENSQLSTSKNHGELLELDNNVYELRTYNLSNSNNVLVTYIDDVSEDIDKINLVTKDMFLTGILALLFSELALLAVLWRPLSRLRNASDIVPLLAANAFSAARHALVKQRPTKYLKNEIDILDENLIDVSHRLERLQKNVTQRTEALAEKMHELTREKDFIQNLLDTAQVIIITQNSNGHINQTNNYAAEISSYKEAELQAINFFDLTLMGDSSQVLKLQFSQILSGQQRSFKYESQFRCKNGDVRIIEWLHSRIESKTTGKHEILSVGLDLTERKAYEEEISWLADHDSLTGLLNRRRFQVVLKNTLNRAKRYKHHVALLFL